MARRSKWRHDEERVITVTPVSRGVVAPALATGVACALVWFAVSRVHFFDEYRYILGTVLILPCVGVLATRLWRWRSHKVHLTSQRIVVEGGVLQHTTSEVELHNLVKTRIDQHWRDRLARRGVVVVETPAGTLNLGLVRHPAALCRLIDNERRYLIGGDVERNAVFDFDAPGDEDMDAGGRRHRGRRL